MIEEESQTSFVAHIEEFRKRLIRCCLAIAVGFGVAYAFKEQLFMILTMPLTKALEGTSGSMIFTGLPEAFFTYLKVSLLAGIIVALPIIFYQFWMFVIPGLYQKERRVILPVVLISLLFFTTGALFAYFLVFPYGFKFFLGFSSDTIQALPSMKEYLSFASKMLLAFGLAFELPVVITALARMGLVTVEYLKKNRKYAILLFFVGSALLTPPDVVTQIMLSIPLMVLYELSIIGARIFGKEPPAKEEPEESDEAEEASQHEQEAE